MQCHRLGYWFQLFISLGKYSYALCYVLFQCLSVMGGVVNSIDVGFGHVTC